MSNNPRKDLTHEDGVLKYHGVPIEPEHISPAGALNVNDRRVQMVNALLSDGSATVDQINRATFGEWPPKGLDIVIENTQRVTFAELVDDLGEYQSKQAMETLLKMHLAEATMEGPDRIVTLNLLPLQIIPRLNEKSNIVEAVRHETLHIITGDGADGATQIYGHDGGYEVLQSQMSLENGDPVAKIFDEHTNTRYLTRESPERLEFIKYINESQELQAHMGSTIAEGYQSWGRVPNTKEQFFVAMKNAGVDIPDQVMEQFKGSPTLKETQHIFSGQPLSDAPFVRKINLSQSILTDAGKAEFWNEGMTRLYADYLEGLGDGPGRARFNLGANPRPALKAQAMQKVIDRTAIFATEDQALNALVNRDPRYKDMIEPGVYDKAKPADLKRQVGKIGAFLERIGKNSGIVNGIIIGGAAGALTLALTRDPAQAAETTFEAAVPYGEAALEAARFNREAAVRAAQTETGATIGGLAGGATGATIGSAIMPGAGTLIGGIVGGLGGGIGGSIVTGYLLDIEENFSTTLPPGIKAELMEMGATENTSCLNSATIHLQEPSELPATLMASHYDTYAGDPDLAAQAAQAGVNITPAILDVPPSPHQLAEPDSPAHSTIAFNQ
ncbi:MAG: hypothetical protein ACLFP8_06225 [Alphaproteobacteria bacterium]